MPALFIFLLKVNAALLIFCAGYYLVLRHLTFYTLNRIYLVLAIVFASVYPGINLSDFAARHQQIAKPVQEVVFKLQAPAQAFVKPLDRPDYWVWVIIVFWTGVALLMLRLLVQLYSLYKLYRNSKVARIYDHDVRVINGDTGPFSFWKSIYVNPSQHEPADLRSILLHEQVHVSEWHTLDILLAELSTIFYWFNPGVWLMKKAIRENIEFITDQKILQNGTEPKQYQYSLVNVSFAATPRGIVNHFNISTIKKRIIMMNAKRSSKTKLTRYAFLVPAVIALLLVFSISKAELIKKSNNAFKTLKSVIHKSGLVTTKNGNTASGIHANIIQNPLSVTTNKPVLNTTAKATNPTIVDTIRKGGVMIGTSEHTDSLIYVINGVKVKKADFKGLDPDKISSIELLTGEQANKLLNEVDSKHSVLFLTTDDSESGKKFKEKMDEVSANSFLLQSKVTGYKNDAYKNNVVVLGKTETINAITLNKKQLVTLKKAQSLAAIDANRVAPLNSEPFVVQYHNGRDSAETYNLNITKEKGMIAPIPKYNTRIVKRTIPLTVVYGSQNLKYAPNKVYVNGYYTTPETNINNISSKLIMIDGNEATEHDLKKLSAADIDSMSIKMSGEMTKQYGDKAKNGVVFIITKKGK
ncbi:MAG: bla regulator protein blaR1 [Mucilaginibacter sp.]|nr:bla regulator protein blaR1 [Mucilaginibacter sp.]